MNKVLPVYIYTYAFNAEDTIKRCVESILNQTYVDFTYIIRDNGSTDKTYEILEEYERRDSRIKLFRNIVNNKYISSEEIEMGKYITDINFNRINMEYYFCLLDADDEYNNNFLEDTISFANKDNLDIVIVGNELINVMSSNKRKRIHNEKMVVSGAGFERRFANYHWNIRQVWGKLYKSNVLSGGLDWLNQLNKDELGGQSLTYGSDTLQTLYRFEKAEKIGILPDIYHYYYSSSKSISHQFDENRIKSDQILYKYSVKFLEKKAGRISLINQSFLYNVYLNAIFDTIRVLVSSNADVTLKFSGLREIFCNKITLEMLGNDGVAVEQRRLLVENVFKAIEQFPNSSEYEDAIWIGMNLSALLERQSDYIKYCKMNIEWLIKHKRDNDALKELGDWDEILSDDPEFRKFRIYLDKSKKKVN